tara:strand:+ start:2343 stop:2681 length:339 start_codon:yes stop_codon:yes gene_type:complete
MKKILFGLFAIIFLPGCFQTTAMVGPTMTLVSSGNLSHALGTYVTNKAVEEETGLNTHELIVKKVEEQHIKQKDDKINKELSIMLEKNIENKQLLILLQNNINKTRNIINSN